VAEQVKYETVPSFPGDTLAGELTEPYVRSTRPAVEPLAETTWYQRNQPLVIGATAVVVFLVAWYLVAQARLVSKLFLPGPLDVIEAYGDLIKEGELAQGLAVSGQEFALGYGIAALLAIPLGLLLGWYAPVRYALDPFITFLYATPRIVLLPLLIIWFGIGVESKVAVVFLGAFFAMVINTTAGVRNLDAQLIKVARSFSASDLQLFRTIALPGSVPFSLTGLRLGIGHALIGVVVGELVAAQYGIGKMMAIAGATFQSSKVFAGLIIIASTGMLLTYILQRLERHFDAWRPQR
jgi:NitT/TauT family transport system permease protein